MPREAVCDIHISLNRSASAALPQQIATALREQVRGGLLRPGWRLPATRVFARQLGVSRVVVQLAYDQLQAEGWVESHVGAGTFIADVGDVRPGRAAGRTIRPLTPRCVDSSHISLRPGTPLADPTPTASWRRAWREVSAAAPPSGYPDPLGLRALREAISEHLSRTRGVACHADEVVVTAGAIHGLRMLLEAVSKVGDRVGVEDPGYLKAAAAVKTSGMRLHDCAVDQGGLVVDRLPSAGGVAAMYVTPAHQYPLGGRLSVARRYALLDWARRHGTLLVEDDYDSEFRYDVAPLPALAHLDRRNVVYLGTASKTLGPSLRIGWLVAEPEVVNRIASSRKHVGDWPSWPLQRALLALFRDGHIDQVVRRASHIYADRCRRVRDALRECGQIVGVDAGLHITLLFPDGTNDGAIRMEARKRGVEVDTVSDYRRTLSGPPGLVIGYGECTDDELDRGLDTLASIIQS